MNFNWQTAQQLVRIASGWVAGALASNGVIADDMTSLFTGTLVGAAAIVWWIVWERTREDPQVPTV